MSELLLPSLEIENFRAFRRLHIPHLSRVNLIVGKNNVGKTSLLETLWLYARRGAPAVIWEQLAVREESAIRNPFAETSPSLTAIRNLFFHRPDILVHGGSLRIGSSEILDQQLTIAIERHPDSSSQQRGILPFFVLRIGGRVRLFTEFIQSVPDIANLPSMAQIPHTIIAANGLTPHYITALWDQIALTNLEEHVVAALRIVAPEIERVNMIADSAIGPQRIAMVRVQGNGQPVALRSYGDGMYRLFVLAVAFVNAPQGILLVDEIESGLHYSVQPDMWRFIFNLAQQLNIQVFATTHSWDCIEAFQLAAAAHREEGQIIRLGRRGDDVAATVFDEHDLALIARDQIEVR
jgi:AAA domain, putative AbiEii toxin, Type IV TA system